MAGILALGLLVRADSVTSYSAICPRCLEAAQGEVREFWGVPYSRRERVGAVDRSIMSPGAAGGDFPEVSARTYKKVMGRECGHSFVKMGFCRSGWGMIGCGDFGEGRRYMQRNRMVEEVYRAYGRMGDAALARASLELLEEIWPVPLPKEERLVDLEGMAGVRLRDALLMPEHPVHGLSGLEQAQTPAEWREVLERVRKGMARVRRE